MLSSENQEKQGEPPLSDAEKERDSSKEEIYREMIIASVQTAFSLLLEFSPSTIAIYFLQQTNNQLWVGSFGLGVLTTMAFGMGIVNAIACGLETLVSQAYGAGKLELCAKLYYRALFLITLLMVPISLSLVFSIQLLDLINDNQDLVYESGRFNRFMILAVYFDGVFANTKCFLNGINIYKYQLQTQLATLPMYIGLNYLFILRLDLGLAGCAISWTILTLVNSFLLIVRMKMDSNVQKVLVPFKRQYLKHTWKFLKAAAPIGAILLLEWICFDFYTMLASFLDVEKVSSHVLMSNLAGVFYQFSYGISIVSTTFVGNEMGALNVRMAKRFSIASLVILAVFLVLSQTIIYFCGDYLIAIMTDNVEVSDQLDSALPLLIGFIILDGVQAILSGLVRAIGRERLASVGFIICYLVIGEILGYVFCYNLGWELEGLWLGIIVGAFLYDLIQIGNMLWKSWEQQALVIQEKIHSLGHQPVHEGKVEDYYNLNL